MACGAGTTNGACNNSWCVGSAATGHFRDPEETPNVRAQYSNFRVLTSERSCVMVGGVWKLSTTGYGYQLGTVRCDHGVRVHIDMPNILIVPTLGRRLF